jgi:hypothetical protein
MAAAGVARERTWYLARKPKVAAEVPDRFVAERVPERRIT